MRVVLDSSLFAGPPQPLELIGLLAICDRMGHTLLADLDAARSWTESLAPPTAHAVTTLLQAHLTHAATLPAQVLRVTVHAGATDWKHARLSLEHAWMLLRTPLELMIENERGDWHFIRRLASPAERALLEQAIARGVLQIRQGGGITEITKSVQALFTNVNQPRLDEHRRVRRLRTWVLFDRDAGRKDRRQPSQEVTAATTACKQHVADDPWPLCWCRLRRRHIECYLPDKVLLDWARDKSAAVQAGVNALIRLRASDPEAAYSLHMKGGLCKDLPKDQRKQLSADSQSADQRTRSAAEQGVSSWTPCVST